MTKSRDSRKISNFDVRLHASKEMVGNDSVLRASEMVMLEVAFTPVIIWPFDNRVGDVPVVTAVSKLPDGEYLANTERENLVIEADALKIMRARFLLWKGYYYNQLSRDTLLPRNKELVLQRFFPQGTIVLPCVAKL